MWTQGAISHELLLRTLQRGEVISEDVDVEAEIELIESSKLDGLDLNAAGGVAPDDEEEGEAVAEEEGDSELRAEIKRRLKKLAEPDDDDDEDD